MATATTRTEFKNYCLRKLGSPVIQINVADEQLEDRIDDALEYYQDYHFDAVEDTYLAHEITQTDIDNKYITINNNIIGIKQVIPLFQASNSSTNMFDIRYQLFLNDVYDLQSQEMLTYQLTQDHLQMVNEMISGRVPIRFNRHMNKLHLDINWGTALTVGENIIIEGVRVIDPDTYTDVWNDRWLKRYATALIKRQWGENITKYEGMTLPGGVTFNGSAILDQAIQEITALEEEMSLNYELPVDIMVG
jgi:hypothetical protein|tara:strand:- start:3868 stop:4614 length:747 start_codon:yes stop_codon:yes gene_type:complete